MVQLKVYGQRHVLAAVRAPLSDALHAAAVDVLGAPPGARFQRWFGLDAQDFPIPAGRTARYTVVEVLMMSGRSPATKKVFYRRLYEAAAALGIGAADLEVVVLEAPAHDWAFRGAPGDEAAVPTGDEAAVPTGDDPVVASARGVDTGEALALYDAVGWIAYTRQPDVLAAALAGSSHVVTARSGGALVGLARVVSDGASIAHLQDVLVHPDHRRRGTGRALVAAAMAPYAAVRQQVLLTDDEPAQRAFYEALGYVEAGEHPAGPLRAFVRMS